MKNFQKYLISSLAIRFIYPMVIGIMLATLATYFSSFEIFITIFYTYSVNFTSYLAFIAPIIVLIYISNATINLSDNIFLFLIKYFTYILITSFIIGIITLISTIYLVPLFTFDYNETQFYDFPVLFTIHFPIFLSLFQALIYSLFLGIIVRIFSKYKKFDQSVDKIKYGFIKIEEYLNIFLRNTFKYLIPPWIIGTYSNNTFGFNFQIIWMDFALSVLILILQYSMIFGLIYLVANYKKLIVKPIIKSAWRINLLVISLAGNGTGVIVPAMVDEQKKLGFSENVAKFVSSSSFNMPGSLISHIVFAYGVALLFGINISFIQMISYISVLILFLIISPSIPGGVFTVTQSLLTPMLGFDENAIGVMGSLYFKQGTSNSAINNMADFYVTPVLQNKNKNDNINVINEN